MKNDLKPYICPQCGGKVNRATLICEMCGTAFKEDSGLVQVVVDRPGVHVLGAQGIIDDWELRPVGLKKASEICIRRLAQEFADSIAPFMEVETERAPWCDQTMIRATLRVVDPKYGFYGRE